MQLPGPPPRPVELESWWHRPSNICLFSQALWVNLSSVQSLSRV